MSGSVCWPNPNPLTKSIVVEPTNSDDKFQSIRAFQFVCQGKTIVTGKMRFACISLKSGKLSRMPKDFVVVHQTTEENDHEVRTSPVP